jgi:phage gp46-like protein
MVTVRIRENEACLPDQFLLWDSIWVNIVNASGGYCDWLMAGADDPAEARGGLRSSAGLHTATLICLFTDRRLPSDQRSPRGDGDPRGWWGDSVRLDDEPDVPLGSLLWTLARGTLDAETARAAEDYCTDALATLIDQGAVAQTTVTAQAAIPEGVLVINVSHYSQAGDLIYDQRFDMLWRQAAANPPMNYIGAG